MKYTLRWISILLVGAMLLTACGGKATHKNGNARFQGGSAVDSHRALNVSPMVKQDFAQALELMRQKDFIRAESLLKKLVQTNPELAGPYINLGIIRLNEGNYEESEKYFKEAIAHKSFNPQAYNYLGVIYRQSGRFEEAEQAYKMAIQQDANFASAYLNIGVLYDLYLRNYAAALNNYKQYLIFNPDDKRVKNWITDIHQRMQATNL
ncbi:MAG: tetratricopeptide repeat protein [Gammaproteobacteria bacterium]|nr:tetratricopeptide repeat protein [Gammaproteobacteria bacterium]